VNRFLCSDSQGSWGARPSRVTIGSLQDGCCVVHHISFRANPLSFWSEAYLAQPNALTKILSSPSVHIATAVYIAAGMAAALAVKLLINDQKALTWILWAAIAGASVSLLVSLVGQILKGNFSVDILALLSIVTSLFLDQYWVARSSFSSYRVDRRSKATRRGVLPLC
jgi:hypothetical protein